MPRLGSSLEAGERQLNGIIDFEHTPTLTKSVELLNAECVTRLLEIDTPLRDGRNVS